MISRRKWMVRMIANKLCNQPVSCVQKRGHTTQEKCSKFNYSCPYQRTTNTVPVQSEERTHPL